MDKDSREYRDKMAYTKYSKSEKGKARALRYYNSSKGREAYRRANDKRRSTEDYKIYQLEHSRTPKRKESLAKYAKTEKRIMSKKIYRATPKNRYKEYAKAAMERGIEFELTFDQFMSYWQKPCNYCGKSIVTIGLDRIVNSIGYIQNNVTPCCWVCNKSKAAMSSLEYIEHCIRVAQFNSQKSGSSKTDIIIVRQPREDK